MAHTDLPGQAIISRILHGGKPVAGGCHFRDSRVKSRGKMILRSGLGLMVGLTIAFCAANPAPSAAAQRAFGALRISGAVEASYFVEAQTGLYTAIGQGVGEGGSLRAEVPGGRTTVRVRKANSRSAAYTLVVRGGQEEIQIRNLSYDAPVTIDIPEAKAGASLILLVLPE